MVARETKGSAEQRLVEGPWKLPVGWRWERLGDLGDWYGGGTPSKANPEFWVGGTIPWVSAKDMKSDYIGDTEDHITEAAIRSSSVKCIPPGSVLCVMRSGILRHSFPVALTTREVTINQDLRAIKPRSEVNAEFLLRFLERAEQDILYHCSKDGTTVNSIVTERLMACPVPIPCREVQDRVVAHLDELFAQIDDGELALAEVSEGVETYRDALLKAAVTGDLTVAWRANNKHEETGEQLLLRIQADRKTRWNTESKAPGKLYSERHVPDTGTLPSLPTGWIWTTAQSLTERHRGSIVIGPFGSDLKVSDYRDEGVPLVFVRHIRARDFTGQRPQYISPEKAETLKAHEVVPGDILVTKMGDPPGDVAVYSGIGPAVITADCIRWRAHPFVSNDFLAAWIASFWGQAWIANNTKGVAQQKITLESFKTMPVALPGPAEQAAIVRAIKTGTSFADQTAPLTDPAVAATLRRSILAAAFRGDLVA